MEIYLMRHGETDWNKAKRIQGSADIPLNDYGVELAVLTAKGLADTVFDRVYTSPLIRAKETARIVAGNRDIPILEDDRLREMGFGSQEGADIADSASDETSVLFHFLNQPEKYKALDGESFSEVDKRVESFVQEVLIPGEGMGWSRVLITAHGALIRCFLNCIRKRPLSEFWNGIPQKNCAVSILQCENGRIKVLEEGRVYY